jgi:diguanylate cyclase (GGDEF)-like protein
VGDEVLRSAALLIKDGLRESDQVARWGGEEFLIMFPDTSCQEAEQVLSRIRHAMALAMLSRTVPDLTGTFSAGVTAMEGDEPLPRMIDRADQALYKAKAAGRNRTRQLASSDLTVTHTHRA